TVNFSRPTGQPTFPTLTGFTIHGSPFGIDCNGADATISHNVVKSGPIDQCDGFILDNRIEGGEGILDPDEALIEGNTILSGGIHGNLSFPTIRDNLITGVSGRAITECHGLIEGNTITYNGFGAISDCDGTIRRNVVAFNTTPGPFSHRAGITECDGIIEMNLIFRNSTEGQGAGISSCNAVIRNNLVFKNHAGRGGPGIVGCGGPIYNNTVFGNTTGEIGGGLWGCEGEIQNNIIWANEAAVGPQIHMSSTPSYCCIQDWEDTDKGNISTDPEFIDSKIDDFRLLPTSPCIDSGVHIEDVTQDFWSDPRGLDGIDVPRGDGSNFDIGADESLGKELFNLNSDIDLSGWVDPTDLLRLKTDWILNNNGPSDSDLNGDTNIDSCDLRILMKDWYRGTAP
ncbi:MAG: hypothetical protein KC964_26000, partial [Candidatus Omnitrophica bacterium]|nr:hypothetical protein [Candidatus Omnitrophota bacterium]